MSAVHRAVGGGGDETVKDQQMETDDESSSEGDLSESGGTAYLPDGARSGDRLLLDYDKSAYVMYHEARTGVPCLSFDVLPDHLGDNRTSYPLTCYAVGGSQSDKYQCNEVIVMKMSNLNKLKREKRSIESSEDEMESEDEDEKPELETAMIRHKGCVNRIRSVVIEGKHLAATFSENKQVYIWDLTRPLNAVNDSSIMATYFRKNESPPPVFKFQGHQAEGFALDWSPVIPGQLATGDCNKAIHVWKPREAGIWHVDQRVFSGHTDSVEDIQWSPNEANVFASCSVDKSIRIWDARVAPHNACMLTTKDAHAKDVNVIHWNRNEPFIVSGGDDGVLKIWDLREFQHGKECGTFKHHMAPITSVEWHATDSSVFMSSGADDQIALWDLSVEKDVDASNDSKAEEPDIPPQLLFIHQGQTEIKEAHWHPQITSVVLSTALTGFNIFKTISV